MTALAATALLGTGAAHTYTVGTFSNGVVVPNVWHHGSADTTAIGLINTSDAGGGDTGLRSIYWTFFDQNSMHITDGCFPMTHGDFEPFVWSTMESGMIGRRGYLVFTIAAGVPISATTCKETAPVIAPPGAGARLSANAFQVDTANHDVAFTPVIDGPLVLALGHDLAHLGPASLVAASGAAPIPGGGPGQAGRPVMNMRYHIDNAPGGNDSFIVVWSTGDQRGTHTAQIHDDKQNRKSVNFTLKFAELDWFDVESSLGSPAGFTDGFIQWDVAASIPADFPAGALEPALALGPGSVSTYTWMIAPAFGAVQTLLGAHYPR